MIFVCATGEPDARAHALFKDNEECDKQKTQTTLIENKRKKMKRKKNIKVQPRRTIYATK